MEMGLLVPNMDLPRALSTSTRWPQAKAAIGSIGCSSPPPLLQEADLANGFMGERYDFVNATLEDKKKGAKNIARAVREIWGGQPIPHCPSSGSRADLTPVRPPLQGIHLCDDGRLPLPLMKM